MIKSVEPISKSTGNNHRDNSTKKTVHVAVVSHGGSVFKKLLDSEMNKVETPGGAERNS